MVAVAVADACIPVGIICNMLRDQAALLMACTYHLMPVHVGCAYRLPGGIHFTTAGISTLSTISMGLV
jgi:hypothetical protein